MAYSPRHLSVLAICMVVACASAPDSTETDPVTAEGVAQAAPPVPVEPAPPSAEEIRIRRGLALALLDENEYAAAWDHLEFVLANGGDSWWLHLGAARICLYWRVDYECVSHHANRALELRPDNVRAWVYLGQAAEDEGDRERAISFYERVVSERPDEIGIAIRLSRLLDRAGRRPEAITLMWQTLEAYPSEAQVSLQLATLVEHDDLELAEILYARSAERHENPLHAYGYLINFYRRHDREADAIELEQWVREMNGSREFRPLR